jgi:hypothetical protein
MIFRKQIVWLLAYVWYPIIFLKTKKALVKLGVDNERASILAKLQIQKQIDKIVLEHVKKGE